MSQIGLGRMKWASSLRCVNMSTLNFVENSYICVGYTKAHVLVLGILVLCSCCFCSKAKTILHYMRFTHSMWTPNLLTHIVFPKSSPKLLSQMWKHTVVYNVFLCCWIEILLYWNQVRHDNALYTKHNQ